MITIKKSQLAIMNIQYKFFPLEKYLEDAMSLGVENVELWGGAPHFHLEDMTFQEVNTVRRAIMSRGLKCVCFTPEQCVYPINIAANTEAERRRSLKFFEDNIRVAVELGADKMLVTSGTGFFDGSNREEAWKYAREGLSSLSELAQLHGIKLALEVLREDESNLVFNLPTLLKMLDEVNHSAIGGILDTIPMNLAGESPKDYLEALGERLLHIHFIDGEPRGHLAWGDGILDMKQYLLELSEGNYEHILSLEITDGRYMVNPTESVRKSIAAISKVLP